MPVREQSAAGVASSGDAMLTEQQSNAEAFRSWHIPGNPIVLFNAWDAGIAKAIAAGGSKAIATCIWWTIERGIDRQPNIDASLYRSDCRNHFGTAPGRYDRFSDSTGAN